MNALHRTDFNAGMEIMRTGFNLNKFGSATKKTGQGDYFKYHARGIFLSEDWGANPKELPPHPWDHRDRGVYIFGAVNLQKPLTLNTQMEGVFYQKWLSDKYGGKTKATLTTALQQEGYDGIFVQDAGEVTVFRPDSFIIDKNKTAESFEAYQAWKSSAGKSFKEWLAIQEADDMELCVEWFGQSFVDAVKGKFPKSLVEVPAAAEESAPAAAEKSPVRQ